jgi:Ran GTPase-activating protein (RanGAP) involved in mRNA processing and transport
VAQLGVRVLTLSHTPLGDAGAAALAPALECALHLSHLRVRECGLGDRGCRLLAGVLRACPSLELLDLSWNRIGPAATAALVDTLPQAEHLHTLGLACCALADAHGAHACHALAARSSWRHVDLSGSPLLDRTWLPPRCPCACMPCTGA